MAKTPLWKEIADRITQDIAKGHHQPGSKLPTEAEYANRFGVNRHTIRHALSALVDGGLVYTRRGAGAFVVTKSVRYSVGKRVRFHQSVQAMGLSANKKILSMTTRTIDTEECTALALTKSATVHVVEGLAAINETPIAHYISIFPAQRFPDLLEHMRDDSSVTESLAACGIGDYTRHETRITAVQANTTTALLLKLKPGAALLRSTNIDVDLNGQPVEYGRTWFSGDHIELTIKT